MRFSSSSREASLNKPASVCRPHTRPAHSREKGEKMALSKPKVKPLHKLVTVKTCDAGITATSPVL